MLSSTKSYINRKVSLTIHCKYRYFDFTVQRAEDRRQKFYFCRLPFAVNFKLNLSIPENLPLSDAEKSVLSKGLNFVPISKKFDEFSVKQDVEKFPRRVQLKASFMIKRTILTPRIKIFSRRFRLENRSGLPQRASLPP